MTPFSFFFASHQERKNGKKKSNMKFLFIRIYADEIKSMLGVYFIRIGRPNWLKSTWFSFQTAN